MVASNFTKDGGGMTVDATATRPVELTRDTQLAGRYIRAGEYPASHYFSAYPEATATTIQAALELEPQLDALKARAPSMSPDEFAAAWTKFVTDNQERL